MIILNILLSLSLLGFLALFPWLLFATLPFIIFVVLSLFLIQFYRTDIGFTVKKISYTSNIRLNIEINVKEKCEINDIYEPLFQFLMQLDEFKEWISPNGAIMITTAISGSISIQLHSNFFVHVNTPLDEFIDETTLNRMRWASYSSLPYARYFYPETLIVHVWSLKRGVKRPDNFKKIFNPLIQKRSLHSNNFTILKKNLNLAPIDIATMDFETYKCSTSGKENLLLISFAYKNSVKTFLLDLSVNSPIKTMFKKWLDHLKSLKSCTIFMHNLGKFDGYLLVRNLLMFDLVKNKDIKVLIDKEHTFISIKLSLDGKIFTIKDSLRIFNTSLKNLTTVFKTNLSKGEYNKLWNDISVLNNKKELKKFIEYAKTDSLALLDVMLQAQQYYLKHYSVDIASILSSSTLSLKIYRSNFQTIEIPTLNKTLDKFIRESYFGGAIDIYKQYGENLHYYDVNSLYPKAMLNPLPLNPLPFETNLWNSELDDFFGFAYAWIKTPKDIKIPLLPFKTNKFEIIFPIGEWCGWYFSEELKEVRKYGYIVKLIKGKPFTKEYLFKDYVHHFYNRKRDAKNEVERLLNKIHLNYIYGFFGRSLDLLETLIVDKDKLLILLKTRVVINIIEIENTDKYVVLLNTNLNHQVIKHINITYPEIKDLDKSVNSNVALASAITSYARIEMMKYKRLPVTHHINVLYSDTDSIFTDKPIPPYLIGSEIGQMKDELKGKVIKRGLFLSKKMYIYEFIDDNNKLKTISVCAGIKRNTLTWNEFVEISKGEVINKMRKDVFYTSLKDLSITIKNLNISIKNRNDKILKDNEFLPPKIYKVKNNDLNIIISKILNIIKYLINKFLP